MATSAELKALLTELGAALAKKCSRRTLRTVRALLLAARSVTRRHPPRLDSPPLLRAALRQDGPLALADFLEGLRREGRSDAEILAQLGWTDARRLRHYLALVPLSGPARTVVERWQLSERQLRPVLKWMALPHFAALLRCVGQEGLTSREIQAWSGQLGDAPSLAQAVAALPKCGRMRRGRRRR